MLAVESDDGGAGYEVEIRKSDGSEAEVELDKSLRRHPALRRRLEPHASATHTPEVEQREPRSDTIDPTSTEGGAMYGRLVEIEGVDASKREEVLGIIRERIIPGLKEIEGFAGFISLVDEENRRARSIVLWETREGADEAERTFAAKREEIVRGMGGTVRSADLYEAPIVEVLAGVRA